MTRAGRCAARGRQGGRRPRGDAK